jgi:hypothetical protein
VIRRRDFLSLLGGTAAAVIGTLRARIVDQAARECLSARLNTAGYADGERWTG